eukprot:TRINITY_DN24646_c0_g1_i3.p1 TRINITY_DN24646_c0_g1~~TRINITY_DN24646_c0_g1_i3.p1  ORF type:complete len:131 (+),score=34.57 TRINITY_DN24646_c0_g1_i3:210-602(+)
MFAAEDGELYMIKSLTSAGADLEARDDEGLTALLVAAVAGHADVVDELVSRGADIGAVSNDGSTAAHLAAKSKAGKSVMEYLISTGGIDPETKDQNGDRPIDVAQQSWKTSPRAFKRTRREIYVLLRNLK